MPFLSFKNLSKSAAFLFVMFAALTAMVDAQQISKFSKGIVRQQAAINKLSGRLPAVAQKYGKTPNELRRVLLEDPTLYVDSTDRLLYIDPAVEQSEQTEDAADLSSVPLAGPFPNSQTFALHSRPGSSRVIYLDFNGHVTSGTAWNSQFTGGQPINSAPFSIDGDPNSFNQQEQDAIQYIWQRVAEDYAPFDVDETTEDPGDAAIIRSSSSDQYYGARAVISPKDFVGGIGGVAYVGVFNYPGAAYKPAFVMSSNLGNSEKSIAEATSHEVGHNMNLAHDGTPSSGYYLGHGDWAPIMGAGYYRSVSQWSKGDYPGANNFQDDLAVMQNYGISLIADDYGDTNGGATVLSESSVNVSGLITTRNDVDVFRFSIGSGNISLNIHPAPRGANLDIQAQISDAQGNVIATSNPSGLSAGFNQFLSGGVYFLTIDGVGAGDFYTGYTDYASVGQYNITGTLPGGNSSQPPVAAISVTTAFGTVPLTVGFSSANSSDPDGSIVAYSWNFGDGNSSTNPNPVHVYNSAETFTAVLTVTDNSGLSDTESVTITAIEPSSNQPPVAVAEADITSGPAPLNVNFFGQNSSDPDGSIVSYSWNFGDGNTSSQTNPSHTYNNVGNYTATLNVTDNNGATNSRSLGINVQSQSPPASNYTLVATPESVAPGSQLTVSWTAPGGSSSVDWIGLFRVGASNYEYGWWQYTDGAPCGSYGLPAPTEPGQYEFRYLLNDGYTSVKTSNVITVGESNPNSTTVIFVNNISMPIANRRGRAVVTVYGNDGLPRPNLSVAGNWSGLSNSASTAYLTAKIR
jgi:PKD repeat protein